MHYGEDVFARRLSPPERSFYISQIMKCYREVNPDKVNSGEVSQLVRKYAGQELLLLRRIQHKYTLEIRRGRVRLLEGRSWFDVTLVLWADGRLEWSSSPDDIKSVDVRNCAADQVESDQSYALVITTARLGATVVACPDDISRRGWIDDLRCIHSFFEKMSNEERAAADARRDHAIALEESVRTHRVEEDSRIRAEEALRIDTARAATLSALNEANTSRSRPAYDESTPEILQAHFEAALEDALERAKIDANTMSPRKAFYAYLDSVEAFVAAKEAVNALPPHHKPAPDIYALIDDGAQDSKQAATQILKNRDAIRRLDDYHLINDPDLPTQLEPVPAIPAAMSKIILDADDL